MFKSVILFAVTILSVTTTILGNIIHVPGNYTTIQAGIEAAVNGDTVLVAEGVFTGQGNSNIDFLGKQIVVESEGSPANCIIDCQNADYGFYFHSGETENSILRGFKVINAGEAGIYVYSADPDIENCVLTENNGYGIYIQEFIGTIDNCEVSDNAEEGIRAFHCGSWFSSAAITDSRIIRNNSQGIYGQFAGLYFSNCLIANNTGTGIYVDESDNLQVINCTIVNNGGGIAFWQENDPYFLLVNSILSDNSGDFALYANAPAAVVNIEYNDIFNNSGAMNVPPGIGVLTTLNLNGDSCDVNRNILLAPEYLDPQNQVYFLQEDSPCIDACNPQGTPDPDNTIKDMGCFYFDQSGAICNVSGLCYLENATNHSGTKVLFAGAHSDSTFTTSSGIYQIDVAAGYYNLSFTHLGYQDFVLPYMLIAEDTVLNSTTLQPSVNPFILSGSISGVLTDTTYIVEENIWVDYGDSLIIEPGAELRFNRGTNFYIHGYLSAIGTQEEDIKFIRLENTLTWDGIKFSDFSDDSNIMKYCFVYGSVASGVSITSCSPTIEYSIFHNNGSNSHGGGINIEGASNPTIIRCIFSENYADEMGGGIYAGPNTNTLITGCTITGNFCTDNDGYGAGVYISTSAYAEITDCIIFANDVPNSMYASGIGSGSTILVSNCIFYSHDDTALTTWTNSIVENCTIVNNHTGLRIVSSFYDNAVIRNNIFLSNNTGISFSDNADPDVVNNSFYANNFLYARVDSIPLFGEVSSINTNGDSCDIFENIFIDPLLVDPVNYNFYLQAISPCIDAGNISSSHDPDSSIADIGAFYYHQTTYSVHIDGYCFLENQTNHAGTKVLFQSGYLDSTFTDDSGYYESDINVVGLCDVQFSQENYFNGEILNLSVSSDTTLQNITLNLMGGAYISGELNGFLPRNNYYITGDISVEAGDSLIIEAGSTFLFDEWLSFKVDGYLQAAGVESDSIKFIPLVDTLRWKGIDFSYFADDSCRLEYCVISGSRDTGIEVDSTCLTIKNSSITDNCVITYDEYGGGIYCIDYAALYISDSNVSGNYAEGYGGGLYIKNKCVAEFVNCTIDSNTSEVHGGGLYIRESQADMFYCSLGWNESGYDGGGLYFYMSHYDSANFIECNFHNNLTGDDGGGTYLNPGNYNNILFDKCNFTENSAHDGGAGLVFAGGYSVIITSCNFIDNFGESVTGIGLSINADTAIIENCNFTGNSGGYRGGGLIIGEGSTTVKNCTITNNSTTHRGGGILLNHGQVSIINCIISGNTNNGDNGAGIYNDCSDVLIENCTFSENILFNQYCYGSAISNYNSDGQLIILNSIFEGNIGEGCIYLDSTYTSVNYCDFYDNQGGNFYGTLPQGLGSIRTVNLNGDSCDVYHNIFLNPAFYSTTGDSAYYLTEDSPCIDAGDPASSRDPDSTIADMGAYYYDQRALHITLTPLNFPIQILPGGGSFNFNVIINNSSDDNVNFDAWIEAVLPDSSVHGPIILRENLTLAPLDSIICDNMTQFVPAAVPPGIFKYRANVGGFPDSVIASEYFEFEKLPGIDLPNHNQRWEVLGWDDEPDLSVEVLPTNYALHPPFPNPFNPETTITFGLPEAGNVRVTVFDILGREVMIIADEYYPAGYHSLRWNASNQSTGIYFIKFSASKNQQVRKVLLLK